MTEHTNSPSQAGSHQRYPAPRRAASRLRRLRARHPRGNGAPHLLLRILVACRRVQHDQDEQNDQDDQDDHNDELSQRRSKTSKTTKKKKLHREWQLATTSATTSFHNDDQDE